MTFGNNIAIPQIIPATAVMLRMINPNKLEVEFLSSFRSSSLIKLLILKSNENTFLPSIKRAQIHTKTDKAILHHKKILLADYNIYLIGLLVVNLIQ